jgi:haloacetate dehalogenase
MFDHFSSLHVDTGEVVIHLRKGGQGSALLLLHGFPQTHVMWRSVAPLLARQFTVVCADLRGYGHSECPSSTPTMRPMPSEPWRKIW